MKFEIKDRYCEAIIYSGEGETLAAVVQKAVKERVDLSGANLSGANLYGANLYGVYLSGAYLSGAYLSGANLSGANLSGANLSGANLSGANLYGANLYGANLSGANLYGANLYGANLSGANLYGANLYGAKDLPPPAVVISGQWGEVSDELCADLMLWDAANHPDPEAFDRWAKGGKCPYDGVNVARAANFKEKTHLWGTGQMCRPYDLMMRLFAEKCEEWTEEQVVAFKAKFEKKEEADK